MFFCLKIVCVIQVWVKIQDLTMPTNPGDTNDLKEKSMLIDGFYWLQNEIVLVLVHRQPIFQYKRAFEYEIC